ncbi:response regulator, partial [Candidatus Pacearchaeota archaeon]|nr:response regulator [Candidatus Pacearchaeota archaeon]
MGNYILLLDSESAERRRVAHVLRTSGFNVQDFEDGLEGLERLSYESPGVVVLSDDVSSIGSFELAQRIKQNGGARNIPIIGYFYSQCDRDFERLLDAQVEKG